MENPPSDPTAQYREIMGCFERRNMAQAFSLLTQTPDPEIPVPYHNLLWGICLTHVQDLRGACARLERELRYFPENQIARNFLSTLPPLDVLPWERSDVTLPLIDLQTLRPVLNLDLNNGCNINCVMCGRPQESPRTQALIPFEVFCSNIAPIFHHLSDFQFGCDHEPLIVPYIERAFEKLCESGVKNRGAIVTNATALSDGKVRVLIDTDLLHVIRISFDGACAATYEAIRRGAKFKHVVERVSRLVSYRNERKSVTKLTFHVTPQPANVAELPGIVRLAKELGVDQVSTNKLSSDMGPLDPAYYAQLVEKQAEAEQAARELGIYYWGQNYTCRDDSPAPRSCPAEQTEQIQPGKCGLAPPVMLLRLEPDGNVYAACRRMGAPVGNVILSKFTDIIAGAPARWLALIQQHPQSDLCKDCWVFSADVSRRATAG